MQALFYGIGAAVIGIIVRSTQKLTALTIGAQPMLWVIFAVMAVTTAWTEREIIWLFLLAGTATAALRAALLPPDRAVDHLPARTVSELAAQRLAHGQPLRTGEVDPAPEVGGEGLCRLYAGARFLGIGQAGPSGVRALRILHADHPRSRPVPC